MNNIYYFSYITEKVYEGGMARNYAFFNKFKTLTDNIYNVYNRNKFLRLIWFFRAILLLLFLRKKIFFLHQGTILILFPIFLFKYKLFRNLLNNFLIYISKNNKLFIEINDLPYEQAIDLELEVKKEYVFLEDLIYSLKNVHYVFASNEMRNFVCLKYDICLSFSQVVINGGPTLDVEKTNTYTFLKQTNKIKFVYAGSLNEGRNIKDIVSIFKEKNDLLLILIGTDGSWLKDYNLTKNIFYLGNFEENKAHHITSLSDIGLLPYDCKKFYYNLCYPTKVSFYITAGIPVLSTPLKELQDVFKDSNSVDFVFFDNWKNYLETIDFLKVKEMKDAAAKQMNEFSWSNILDSLKI